ncbi:hypothetical protein OS493_038295 [Desmophyllum pertusum]|uniref:GIY-YIG domain-containing protein n=1 Tax=Desmophyllum pertusum TaxID=174260 RepID=A0A9W9ZI84_9CNID|nr:hypothetical protein OS493_038295 [Desmophyllum pertusum]
MATKFKSAHVGKYSNLTEEIEKLPEDLKDVWRKRQFNHFLEQFKNIISNLSGLIDDERLEDIIHILPFLSELGHSFDLEIHRLIRDCYELCDKLRPHQPELRRSFARSCNKYVLNILYTEKMKLFLYQHIRSNQVRLITWCLNFSCVPDVPSNAIEEQTFKVEEELRLEFQKQSGSPIPRDSRYKCVLQRIVLEFMDKLYIYPLAMDPKILKFLKLPGVYFIYYVGETKLYKGSQVSPSIHYPVYVGKSEKDIGDRLSDHYKKIAKSEQKKHKFSLNVADFVVRFMIVDVEYYAPAIEGMLIKYFSPVWNKETVGFSFGNANSRTNTWNKFHIQGDEKTINDMLENLTINA